jgi:thiaminase/transcriptional activator TenA
MAGMTGEMNLDTDESFTVQLRARAEPEWTDATEHRFTEELIDGTISDEVFRRYLVQDFAFVNTLASVIGYGAGQAPTLAAKAELAAFLRAVATDETDYFERAFDALSVSESDRKDPALNPTAARFDDHLTRAALEGGYAETLAVIVPAEWIYLTWADRAGEHRPEQFYLAEWIDLHTGEGFESTVAFLREELESIGPTLSRRRSDRVARLFDQTVALEVDFFEMAYESD